jgi:DNA polymerase-3 subunit gamma/tau
VNDSNSVTPAVEPVAEITPPAKPKVSRVKSTLNLQNILTEKPEENKPIGNGIKFEKRKILKSEIVEVWQEFALKRKAQVAEYGLLQHDFDIDEHTIKLQLTNPVELTLLDSIKSDLLTFLKERLQCDVTLEGVLLKTDSKKMIYTNKEKFDHLAEKHPALLELKDRLGLDTDY